MAEDANTYKRSRASGEVLDYLLLEFENNPNPTPEQRKEIADKTGMSEKAVRIWFQNKRAKVRKFERLGRLGGNGITHGGGSNSISSSRSNSLLNLNSPRQHMHVSNILTSGSTGSSSNALEIPIEVNDKYCFIDCSSLSVGSWQRIRTGYHDGELLRSALSNLSPIAIDQVMNNVDLLVILSKKNLEINYFFCVILNNSKILFRIFFPVSSIISCLLLDNNIDKGNSELRLSLTHRPKFSVYFFNAASSGSNKWSICDDFSEGHQVSLAYYAESGTSIPHVLVGVKNSLQFLNSYILENKVYGTASVASQVSGVEPQDDSDQSHQIQQHPHHHQQHQQQQLDDTPENHDLSAWNDATPRHPNNVAFSPTHFDHGMSPSSTQSPLVQQNNNFAMETGSGSSGRANTSETPASMVASPLTSLNAAGAAVSNNGQFVNAASTTNSQATPHDSAQLHVGNSFSNHAQLDGDHPELEEMFHTADNEYFNNQINQTSSAPLGNAGTTIPQSTHIEDALMQTNPANVHGYTGYTNSPFPTNTPFDYFEDPDKSVPGQVTSPSNNTHMDTFIDYLSHYVN